MNLRKVFVLLFVIGGTYVSAQKTSLYKAGFKTVHLIDSTRRYKPDVQPDDKLYYRPLDLDIWYPSEVKKNDKMLFEDLFVLHEERANYYQDEEDYTGFSEELILYLAAGFGLDANDGKKLLKVKTDSYKNAPLAKGKFPLIIYMSGYNGMGWESYRMLETLAENGFVVLSISSIGQYPGDMTNDLSDTMEQVNDASFAMEFMQKNNDWNLDVKNTGILGLSWGGMSGILLLDKYPDIKAMVSLDGTDNFYYGDSEEDDQYLSEIYAADLIHPEKTTAAFMHLEAGDRFSEFSPTDKYRYIDSLSSHKQYLRFSESKHEDFSSIAWALKSSEKAVSSYKEIMTTTLLFFQKYAKGINGFSTYVDQLIQNKHISDTPEDYENVKPKTQTLKGSVKNKKNLSPLSFVNIGLMHSEIGTVSNKNGAFEIQIPSSETVDSLRFSMIGYKSKILPLKNLSGRIDGIEILMEEEISELNEIVLQAKTVKKRKLGNETTSNFIGHLFYYDQLGKEMGIKLNVNRQEYSVEAFNFHVSYNRFSAKSFFRLNIYELDRGKPLKNILKENILIPVEPKQTGLITTDLKPYGIVLDQDVIVSLEWIDTEGEVKPTEALVISLGLFTGGVYERNSKEAKMKKRLRGMGLGFTMDVRY